MLSYLHNIVFLVLVRLRNSNPKSSSGEKSDIANCVEQLVELRAILEKGVKPIEMKLRYQIDKVVRKSLEAEMTPTVNGRGRKTGKDGEESDEEGSDSETDEEEKERRSIPVNVPLDIDGQPIKTKSVVPSTETALTEELSYRPTPHALTKPKDTAGDTSTRTTTDGIYRPPRISATAMPTTNPLDPTAPTAPTQRLSKKSHSLEAFIASELSTAPLAEPSIGSTIVSGGRGIKTAQARREETERRDYEEANFVRLPKLSKKEQRQKSARDKKISADSFGGEDWRSFAGDLDRLTARATSGKGSGRAALEKSRKRKDSGVGGQGENVNIGGRFSLRVGRESNRKRRKA